VPHLVPPTTDVHRSFLASVEEFRAEGRGGPADDSSLGRDMDVVGPAWSDPRGFALYVDALCLQSQEDAPRPDGYVPSTTLWWIDGTEFLGRIQIRHRLTPHLYEVGGHIGYDVRPNARRLGHATTMLRAALPVAAELGITSALITCDTDNVASRKVIEANGGVLDDERHGKLRYWVATA
jgi:predicted acetyltransferase